MTIAMVITEEVLTSDTNLGLAQQIAVNATAQVGRSRFCYYIDDICVLGTDGKEVNKVHDRIYSEFSKKKKTSIKTLAWMADRVSWDT